MSTSAIVPVPSVAYPAASIGTAGLLAAYALALAAGAVGAIVPIASLNQGTNAIQVNWTPQSGGLQDEGILLVSSDSFATDIAIAKIMAAGDFSTQVPVIGGYFRVWRTNASAGDTGTPAVCSVSVVPAGGGTGGPAYVNGGNAFGAAATIGPVDSNTFQVGGLGTSTSTTVLANTIASVIGQTGLDLLSNGGPILLQGSGNSSTVVIDAGGTAEVDVATGLGGVDTNNRTARFNVGVAVKTTEIGSTNTTSITHLMAGSRGNLIDGAIVIGAPVAIVDGTGTLGTPAATVDISGRLVVTQTTPVVTQAAMRTLQPPTVTTAGRRCIVESAPASTASFPVGDATIKQGINLGPGEACEFEWSGPGGAWVVLAAGPQDPIQGPALADANATPARAGKVTQVTLPAGTLTAPRTCTPPTTGAIKGDLMIVTRMDVSANTYTVIVASTTVMPASKQNACTLRFDGAAWQFLTIGVN